MMWVSKVPNYDAYGLFRALHFYKSLMIIIANLVKFKRQSHLHGFLYRKNCFLPPFNLLPFH